MIRFTLACDQAHSFEAWFSSSDDFDSQKQRGLIECPHCGSAHVDKALMAPSVSTSKDTPAVQTSAMPKEAQEIMTKMRELRDAVLGQAENVGKKFPEEARKIHYGESEERGIYGESNRDDVEALLDEGIAIAPLPVLPDDRN